VAGNVAGPLGSQTVGSAAAAAPNFIPLLRSAMRLEEPQLMRKP